eukprot:7446686-Heterocapsa_arctica.AAC.1
MPLGSSSSIAHRAQHEHLPERLGTSPSTIHSPVYPLSDVAHYYRQSDWLAAMSTKPCKAKTPR